MQGFKKIVSCLLVSLSLTMLLSPFSVYAGSYSPTGSHFDARNYYKKPLEPKYQQISGPCWAFAAMATLEAYLSKNGLLKESLSERHLLNWANRICESGWKFSLCNGGNFLASTGYFASGDGAVLSSQCPFDTNNNYFNRNRDNLTPAFSVRGIQFFPDSSSIADIKGAVANYGAVCASTDSHSVSIIGWDDQSHSWIVKDSGVQVSYGSVPYSASLSQVYCIKDAKPYDKSEKIYQYDRFATNCRYNCAKNLTCSNVFDFSSGETLDSVMVRTSSKGAKIKIYSAHLSSGDAPNPDKSTWQQLYSGTVPYDGYCTYSLDKNLTLTNQKCAIIVSIAADDASLWVQEPGSFLECTTPPKTSFRFDGYHFVELDSSLSIKAITKKH